MWIDLETDINVLMDFKKKKKKKNQTVDKVEPPSDNVHCDWKLYKISL